MGEIVPKQGGVFPHLAQFVLDICKHDKRTDSEQINQAELSWSQLNSILTLDRFLHQRTQKCCAMGEAAPVETCSKKI